MTSSSLKEKRGPHIYRHDDGKLYGHGWNRPRSDRRDHGLSLYIAYRAILPPKVDLTVQQTRVYNQGQEGSCSGFSTRSAMEYDAERLGYLPLGGFSPAFIYYEARALEGIDPKTHVPKTQEDSGIDIRNACKVLLTRGICSSHDDPYVAGQHAKPPSRKAVEDARQQRILAYASLTTIEDMRNCLALLGDFVIGIPVYKDIYDAPHGVLSIPVHTQRRTGLHALCAVGYNDDKKWLIFKNSWGTKWGDAGYGYLPYEYVDKASAKGLMEAWRAIPRGKIS